MCVCGYMCENIEEDNINVSSNLSIYLCSNIYCLSVCLNSNIYLKVFVYMCVFVSLLDYIREDLHIQGAHNKFPDFFRMGIFIDSIHMKV